MDSNPTPECEIGAKSNPNALKEYLRRLDEMGGVCVSDDGSVVWYPDLGEPGRKLPKYMPKPLVNH